MLRPKPAPAPPIVEEPIQVSVRVVVRAGAVIAGTLRRVVVPLARVETSAGELKVMFCALSFPLAIEPETAPEADWEAEPLIAVLS
jgi:hypothetical protein